MNVKILLSFAPVLLAQVACVTPTPDRYDPSEPYRAPGSLTHLVPGQTIAQGLVGASFLAKADRDGGNNPPVPGQAGDFEQVPMLGGVFQHAMWGDRVDMGLEVGGTLGFQTGGGYVYAGGGGLTVAVDINMSLFDLFGGPFISLPLGNKARVYGSAGPLLQFANWDQTGIGVNQTGTGFGTGLYTRAGFEYMLSRTMLIGIGLRWTDSRVSLGSGLGSLDLQGTQALISFTAGV